MGRAGKFGVGRNKEAVLKRTERKNRSTWRNRCPHKEGGIKRVGDTKKAGVPPFVSRRLLRYRRANELTFSVLGRKRREEECP